MPFCTIITQLVLHKANPRIALEYTEFIKQKTQHLGWVFQTKAKVYFFFAFLFGKSVIDPSKISAARPIDSFKVGCA